MISKISYGTALAIVFFLLRPLVVNAENSVTINNKVNVNANTSSSSNSTSKTNIKITTNGETKEWTAEGNEKISYESPDGNVKVNVNNNSTSTTSTTSDEDSDAADDKTVEEQQNEIKEKVEQKKQEIKAKVEEQKKEDDKKMSFFDQMFARFLAFFK